MYTLTSNPSLRVYRKSYMQYMKMLQERLARHYSLDTKTVGTLVQSMNNAFVNENKADINDVSVEVGDGRGLNAAQANWNALFGMSKLLKQIQKDMADKKGMFSEESMIQEDTTGDKVNGNSEQSNNGTNVFVKTPANMWKKAAFLSLKDKTADPSTNL